MPYVLKESDGSHREIGTSNGNRVDEPNGTFWVTGWSDAVRNEVEVGLNYLLQLPAGNSQPVELKQKGGGGQGGLRFELTG